MAQVAEFETTKTTRIHEAEFPPVIERETRMSMGYQSGFGRGDKQAPCHTKVDDPLERCAKCCGGQLIPVRPVRSQIAHNMLADTPYRKEACIGERSLLHLGRRFHGFRISAEPGADDTGASDAFVDASRNRLHFG